MTISQSIFMVGEINNLIKILVPFWMNSSSTLQAIVFLVPLVHLSVEIQDPVLSKVEFVMQQEIALTGKMNHSCAVSSY